MQSSRELYERQIDIERQELSDSPEEEMEELALIYRAKGLDPEQARATAERIISRGGEAALDTLVREELAIDQKELGGSAWEAASSSFSFSTSWWNCWSSWTLASTRVSRSFW